MCDPHQRIDTCDPPMEFKCFKGGPRQTQTLCTLHPKFTHLGTFSASLTLLDSAVKAVKQLDIRKRAKMNIFEQFL